MSARCPLLGFPDAVVLAPASGLFAQLAPSGLGLGLRPGELLGLAWADTDFDAVQWIADVVIFAALAVTPWAAACMTWACWPMPARFIGEL